MSNLKKEEGELMEAINLKESKKKNSVVYYNQDPNNSLIMGSFENLELNPYQNKPQHTMSGSS
jgi:hypothetical protein